MMLRPSGRSPGSPARRRHKVGLWSLLCVSFLSTHGLAGATQFDGALGLTGIAAASDRIVVARVQASQIRWNGSMLETLATIEVEETLKGSPERSLQILVPGGSARTRSGKIRVSQRHPVVPRLMGRVDMVLFLRESVRPSLMEMTAGPIGPLLLVKEGGRRMVRGVPGQGTLSLSGLAKMLQTVDAVR